MSDHKRSIITSFPVNVALGLGVLIVIAIIAWWFLQPRDDGTLVEIQRRGTLRVGLDASFPPFEMIDAEGNIIGLDVDIARAIVQDLGVELEIVNIGFDGLYDALLARRVDLILSGLPYDPRWTQDVAYTQNYFNAGQVLIVRQGNQGILKIEDLDSQLIAVEWGSQADMETRQLQKELGQLEISRQETAEAAIVAVIESQVDAAIVDAVSGASAVPRGIHLVTYLTDEWYAGAVHIESQALLEAIDASLDRLNDEGEMQRIQAFWLHGQ